MRELKVIEATIRDAETGEVVTGELTNTNKVPSNRKVPAGADRSGGPKKMIPYTGPSKL